MYLNRLWGVNRIKQFSVSFVLFLFALSGCSLGPKVLPGDRMGFNISLQKSNAEELLVNLVRARYFEHPLFLHVGSISSSFNIRADAKVGGGLFSNTEIGPRGAVSSDVGAGYSETPTITYTPVQGEQSAKRLLAEINLGELVLLARGGCRMDILMRMLVKEIGPLSASPVNKIKAPNTETSYDKYMELSGLLYDLQMRGDLEFVDLEKDDEGVISVIVQMRGLEREEVERVTELLGISPSVKTDTKGHPVVTFRLVPVKRFLHKSTKDEKETFVPIRLRNFIEVLFLLSWGVDVPKEHIEKGTARSYISPKGKVYDLREYYQDLFTVRAASREPSNAYVGVFYRGYYYYISDDDVLTKEVLTYVSALYDLQSADIQSVQPLLTIPVNR